MENIFILYLSLAYLPKFLVLFVFALNEFSQGMDSLLFRMLVMFDEIILFIQFGLHSVPQYFRQSIITYCDWTCIKLEYIYFIYHSMSALTLGIITLERALALIWPLHFGNKFTMQRCLILIGTLMGTAFSLYFPIIFTIKQGVYGSVIPDSLPGYIKFFSEAQFVMNTVLPVITVLIGFALITRALRESHRFSNYHQRKCLKHVVPILRFPHAVYIFLQMVFSSTPCSCAFNISVFLRCLSQFCDCLNHSINMFLDCITGKKIRKALKSLFLCDCCRKRTS